MASQKRHAIRRAQVNVRQCLRPVTIAYLRISVAWLNTVTAFGEEVNTSSNDEYMPDKRATQQPGALTRIGVSMQLQKRKAPAMKLILTRFWTNTIKDFKIYCILQ